VEGCLEWQLDGLRAPEEVRQATGEYREEMDVLGAFLDECCKFGSEENVSARELYEAYAQWCTDTGEQQETQRKFGRRLTERGVFTRYKGGANGGHRWKGLDLLTLWKSRISRYSDPTDAKVTINDSKKPFHRVNSTSGSDGSEGSAGPVSFDLQPGESASVEEIRGRRQRGAGKEETGPLTKFFDAPPAWFRKQAASCAEQGSPERLVKPLVCAVSCAAFGAADRHGEVRPTVEAWLEGRGDT